ncbi:uncharacterized protein E0L32_002582 [Thyridium curvatum]|uniref:Cyclin-D1-binding protein 1-like N-terminal domain-containing protein n=1 Tax=Thyridium curvatum TaxID=1093900 RepID=A0A507B6G9_9PEZI|nr:uncharacterized protein E0L32_002582 [Thyridium curvatum]TPX18725.1 hypothetical protein E0L32_002582 [Thyridium curvatum]
MASSSESARESELEALNALVDTSIQLVKQLQTVITQITTNKVKKQEAESSSQTTSGATNPETGSSAKPVDALALASDSVSLIRAYSTQISLFIINEPFTPSVISRNLRELIASPIPGLASAVELCAGTRYTNVIRHDLALRCNQVFLQLRGLLERIPRDGKILQAEKKNGGNGDKGSVAATGVLWAACDEVTRFAKLGVDGHLAQKVEQYKETLDDVLEELKEWGEETDEDDDDEVFDDGDDVDDLAGDMASSHLSAQAMLDDLMSSHRHIPSDDPDKIRDRLDSCLKRLRLTTLLYQAIIKRRLKTLPALPAGPDSNVPSRLNEIMPILRKMTERFGDLAAAFYDLSPGQIDNHMDQCFFDAFAASELLAKPWDGQKDGFTDWVLKFQGEIKKSN